jgi:hypothetical protein
MIGSPTAPASSSKRQNVTNVLTQIVHIAQWISSMPVARIALYFFAPLVIAGRPIWLNRIHFSDLLVIPRCVYIHPTSEK